MNQIKHIVILNILSIIFGFTTLYGQLDIENNSINVRKGGNNINDTLLFYEYKYYFDPLYNAILRNISFSNCWEEGRKTDIRNVNLKVIHKYLLYYQISNEEIYILTIRHGSKNPKSLRLK